MMNVMVTMATHCKTCSNYNCVIQPGNILIQVEERIHCDEQKEAALL